MLLVKRKGSCDGVTWRCPRKGCRKELALRGGTLFEGSHLSLLSILRIIHLWSTKTPVGKTMSEIEVTDHTAVDWYNFIRDVCAQYFLDHSKVIGSPGVDSKFGRKKYNRGRRVDGHWVFGGDGEGDWRVLPCRG